MNRKKICWLAAVVAYATTAVAQIEKVNPVIGTDGMGHTFPGTRSFRLKMKWSQ